MAELTLTTREALKGVDPDRYRAALMAEERLREDLIVLYAFHHELAKVPEVTSEPMLGQIRYQWWREAVDEIYAGGEVRRHEVTTPLTEVLRRTGVPRFWIDQLIDGRARDLDPQPFADMAAARSYAQQTSGQLMRIAARIAGAERDAAIAQAGEAWGLTGLTRSWRFYHDRILQNLNFEELLGASRESYEAARQGLGKIDNAVLPTLIYTALVPGFLKRLSRPGFDPLADTVDYGPLAKQARLMRAALRGRI